MKKFDLNVYLPKIVWILSYWITSTLRYKRMGFDAVMDLKKRNERIIYALWHGRHFITYHKLPPDNVHILVSPSQDGRRVAALLMMSGFSIVQVINSPSSVGS